MLVNHHDLDRPLTTSELFATVEHLSLSRLQNVITDDSALLEQISDGASLEGVRFSNMARVVSRAFQFLMFEKADLGSVSDHNVSIALLKRWERILERFSTIAGAKVTEEIAHHLDLAQVRAPYFVILRNRAQHEHELEQLGTAMRGFWLETDLNEIPADLVRLPANDEALFPNMTGQLLEDNDIVVRDGDDFRLTEKGWRALEHMAVLKNFDKFPGWFLDREED